MEEEAILMKILTEVLPVAQEKGYMNHNILCFHDRAVF